jgi:hypothetical protein
VRDSELALAAVVATANANDQAAYATVVARQTALNALVASGATAPEIAAAEAELALARATAEATRLAGDGDVTAAQAAVSTSRST